MIMIWYLAASAGSAPARIWPVIRPGRLTMPARLMMLSSGVIAVRKARRSTVAKASKRVAPSAMRASIAARSRSALSVSVCSARLQLVSVLPSTMPRMGTM